MEKIKWSGKILSIQPRTNVWRYRCDNRTHSHTGYNIFLDGVASGEQRQFSVAISENNSRPSAFVSGMKQAVQGGQRNTHSGNMRIFTVPER